jgi:hypothetical protein
MPEELYDKIESESALDALNWKGSAYRTPQKAQQMGTLKWSFPAQQMGTFSESISTKMHFFGSTTFSQIP